VATVSLGLVFVFALGGCGGGSSGSPEPGVASSTASVPTARVASTGPSPSPGLDPEQAALAAYRNMIADWVAAAARSDYGSTRLSEHASGAALALITRVVFDNFRNKVVSKGEPVISPSFVEANSETSPTRIKIVDCLDGTHWLNYKANGQLQDNIPGGRSHTEALVVLVNGVWKVDQLAIQKTGTC
jgi:hypothetical protein